MKRQHTTLPASQSLHIMPIVVGIHQQYISTSVKCFQYGHGSPFIIFPVLAMRPHQQLPARKLSPSKQEPIDKKRHLTRHNIVRILQTEYSTYTRKPHPAFESGAAGSHIPSKTLQLSGIKTSYAFISSICKEKITIILTCHRPIYRQAIEGIIVKYATNSNSSHPSAPQKILYLINF